MTLSNFVPRENDNGQTLGTPQKQWSNVYANDLTLNGESVNNKLQNMQINITPQLFGAKGDGVTDDTAALNAFFAYNGKTPKVIPKGTYKTTQTIFIPGQWRGAGGDYGAYSIKFDDAQINYQGSVGGCSVIIYNHFRSHINGLSISRASKTNFVQVTGCWHTQFENWGIYSDLWLNCNTNGLLVKDTDYTTESIMHLNFTNMWMQGTIDFDASSTSFINSVKFDKCSIGGNQGSIANALVFHGGRSYQNIIFDASDLSYYSDSLVKLNGEVTNGTVTFRGVYFDTLVPTLDRTNGMQIIYDNCYFSADGLVPGTLPTNSLPETILMHNCEANCPSIKQRYSGNLVTNGNFSTTAINDVFTGTPSNTTRVFAASDRNPNGRKMTIAYDNGTYERRWMYVRLKTSKAYSPISFVMRGTKVSGQGVFKLGVKSKYKEFDMGKFADGEDFVLAFCPARDKQYWVTVGEIFNIVLECATSSGNLTVDIYEMIVCNGTEVEFNMPCEP